MSTLIISDVLALWPHVLTPTVFVLFFTLPPFPHRGTLLTIFTASMIYPCLFAPAEYTGHTPSVRYGMVAMWLFYAGWLAKMLFHRPEHDFWRKGKPEHEAEGMGFGWEKFKWALSLLLSWRGVGWNIQPKKLPPPRKRIGRWRFVLKEVGKAVMYYVATDGVTVFYQESHFHNASESVADLGWGRRIALEVAIGASIWWMFEYQYAVYSAFLVAIGLYNEEDFLPLFGDLTAVHSLGAFWGQFWHQNCRLVFTDYSRALAYFFRIPHRSYLYWPLHAWTAFIISGLLHSLPCWSLPTVPPFDGIYERFASLFLFFILQAVGLTLETMFFISPGEDILLYEIGAPDVWILGRLWTFSWLFFTGRFVLECYLKTEHGMLALPFSFFTGKAVA